NSIFSDELTVVTFNGKSFDLPLLTDRFIINRVGRKLNFKHHLDLLHSARRIFKRRLQSCTLTNLERELFDFYRKDDVPGYLVPSVFFDWLTGEDLSMMNAVIEHNRLDIVSLFFLARLIAEAYSTTGGSLGYSEDLHSLSKWYDRRKEREKIEVVYNQAEMLSGDMSAEAVLFYARSFKRLRKFDECIELLSKVTGGDSKHGFLANIELAVHYEHRTKDLHKALDCATQAGRCEEISSSQKVKLRKRVERLKLKLKLKKSKPTAGKF
ncbi:MAG: ribonuclease H-like domain-containing protein, partial [candidate division Zixibacteria bacterium]|nr:ribonuclease H-like domain-containing protein [candidate division Zixibacteria bacterium]